MFWVTWVYARLSETCQKTYDYDQLCIVGAKVVGAGLG